MTPFIVVHDPNGRLPEGLVLVGENVSKAEGQGVDLLPVNLQLMRLSGIGGYVKRSFGKGWTFDPVRSSRGPTLMMYATPSQDVHWKARIERLDPPKADETALPPAGQLRVCHDPQQPGALLAGLHGMEVVQLSELGDCDPDGGWTIGGRFGITSAGDGFLGLQLYGTAQNCRVVWFAASQPG